VAIFARRSYDSGELPHLREFFASNRITRVYLEDWLDRETNYLGISIVQLILTTEAKAPEFAKQLAAQVEQETTLLQRAEIVEFIEAVLREEIQAMFTIDDLKQTRYYRDAMQEGRQEGVIQVAINLLNNGMPIEQVANLTDLSIEQVSQLQSSQIAQSAQPIDVS